MAAETKAEININVREELQEIVDVTMINACFILNSDDNSIVQSMESLSIDEGILWELSVLKDTFQQFATGIKHGTVKDLSLEGDDGFIFLYSLSAKYTLVAVAPETLNLPYLKLAMYDILLRMERKIEAEESRVKVLVDLQIHEMEEKLRKEEEARLLKEAEEAKKLEEERKKLEAEIKKKEEERKKIEEERKRKEEERIRIEEERKQKAIEEQKKLEEELKKTAEEAERIKLEEELKKREAERIKLEEELKKEEEQRKKKAIEEQKKIEKEIKKEAEERAKLDALKKKEAEEEAKRNILEDLKKNAEPKITGLVNSIANTAKEQRLDVLAEIFSTLKDSIGFLKGDQLGNLFEILKEAVLEHIGTSLALYDISKKARELVKVKEVLTLKQVSELNGSIDKWVERLIKK